MPRIVRRLVLSAAVLAALFLAAALAWRPAREAWAARACALPAGGGAAEGGAPSPYATTGMLLVANQASATATIVDLATGAATHLPAGEEPHDAAVSPDGRWGVVSDYGNRNDGNRLVVIDMAAKRVARTIDVGQYRGVHDLAFLPGSSTRVVVTAQKSRAVVEVDLRTGVVAAVETRGGGSHSLALAGDGRALFTANEEDTTVSRLDLASRAFVRHLGLDASPEGIAVTPDGRHVWAGSRETGTVKVLDAATGAVVASLPGFGTPDRIAMSRDGRLAAVADFRCGAVAIADVPGLRLAGAVTGLDRPHAVEIAPDGRVAFVSVGGERAVAVVDLQAWRVLARHRVQKSPDGVSWGPTPPR